jgi:hypothetical protein
VRRLIAVITAVLVIGLQQPSNFRTSNISSAEATTYGRASPLRTNHLDWASAEAFLMNRGFRSASSCFQSKIDVETYEMGASIEEPRPETKTYDVVTITWTCGSANITHCYSSADGKVICGQEPMHRGRRIAEMWPQGRGKTIRMYQTPLSTVTNGTWNFTVSLQCWPEGPNGDLICFDSSRAYQSSCTYKKPTPPSHFITAGWLGNGGSIRYRERAHVFKLNGSVAQQEKPWIDTEVWIRPGSPLEERMKSVERKRINITIQETGTPDPQDSVSQQGKLLLIHAGYHLGFGVGDIQVRTSDWCALGSDLRQLHGKDVRLTITPES